MDSHNSSLNVIKNSREKVVRILIFSFVLSDKKYSVFDYFVILTITYSLDLLKLGVGNYCRFINFQNFKNCRETNLRKRPTNLTQMVLNTADG